MVEGIPRTHTRATPCVSPSGRTKRTSSAASRGRKSNETSTVPPRGILTFRSSR